MKKITSFLLVLVMLCNFVISASALKPHNDSNSIKKIFSSICTEIEYCNARIEAGDYTKQEASAHNQLIDVLFDLAECYCFENMLAEMGDVDTAFAKNDQEAMQKIASALNSLNVDPISKLRVDQSANIIGAILQTEEDKYLRSLSSSSNGIIDNLHDVMPKSAFPSGDVELSGDSLIHDAQYAIDLGKEIKIIEKIIKEYNICILADTLVREENAYYFEMMLYRSYLNAYIDLIKLYYEKGMILVEGGMPDGEEKEQNITTTKGVLTALKNVQNEVMKEIRNNYNKGLITAKQTMGLYEQVAESVINSKLYA